MPLALILGGLVVIGAAGALALYAQGEEKASRAAPPPPAANRDPSTGDPLAKSTTADGAQTMSPAEAPAIPAEETAAAEPPDRWAASAAATTAPVVVRTVERAFPDYEAASVNDERYGYEGDNPALGEPAPSWTFDDAAAADYAQAPNQPGGGTNLEWH